MKDTARYFKIVTWSVEDQCFIDQCPGIIGPCCHCEGEAQVFRELFQILGKWITLMKLKASHCLHRPPESICLSR